MSVSLLARFRFARAAAIIIITDYQRKGKGMVLTLLQLLQGILLCFWKLLSGTCGGCLSPFTFSHSHKQIKSYTVTDDCMQKEKQSTEWQRGMALKWFAKESLLLFQHIFVLLN